MPSLHLPLQAEVLSVTALTVMLDTGSCLASSSNTGVVVVGRRVQPGLVVKDIRRCLVQHIRGASQSGHIDISTTKEDSKQNKKVWKRAHST